MVARLTLSFVEGGVVAGEADLVLGGGWSGGEGDLVLGRGWSGGEDDLVLGRGGSGGEAAEAGTGTRST